MDFVSQWKEISEDISIILDDISLNGMTQKNESNIKQTQEEINQLLSLIPSIFLDHQKEKDITQENITGLFEQIRKFKTQSELALTILNEFNNSVSPIKMRNLMYTWNLRDEIGT